MVRAIAIVSAVLLGPTVAAAQEATKTPRSQESVCLVTFSKADTKENADVVSAKVMARKEANAQKSETKKVFEYGPNGELTAEACACLDDPATRASCSQPVRPKQK
jgi:hypothetical protein